MELESLKIDTSNNTYNVGTQHHKKDVLFRAGNLTLVWSMGSIDRHGDLIASGCTIRPGPIRFGGELSIYLLPTVRL